MNGIFLVDKPRGPTSHDIVLILRRKLQFKKIGHAGTLDPLASGLLIMLLGKATKLSSEFLGLDKAYSVRITLGVRTDTADAAGKIIREKEVPQYSREAIEEALLNFKGESWQIPPMVSAKKVNGQKLYRLARKGISITRQPHKINITGIKLTEINLPHLSFELMCSKGTYVRSLTEDIGEYLGCGAHVCELRRTACGNYNIKEALKLDEIIRMEQETLVRRFLTLL